MGSVPRERSGRRAELHDVQGSPSTGCQFLIECKSAGTDLKDNHLRQATDYAANEGVEWVLLTNGIEWHAHRVRFEQPIRADEVFQINILAKDAKPSALLERLYLISREGASATAIDDFWEHKEATSRYVVAQLLLGEAVVRTLRRQLRQLYSGIKVADDEIVSLLTNEVIKRDAIEGERAAAAAKSVRRGSRRRTRSNGSTKAAPPVQATAPGATVPPTTNRSDARTGGALEARP
jgi:hypothetical protein